MSAKPIVDAGFACTVCGLTLNPARNEITGQEIFVHARAWLDHGHEPVPAPVNRVPGRILICDFCGDTGAAWKYHGSAQTPTVSGVSIADTLDGLWVGCNACDPFVRRNDVDGLLNRYVHSDTPKYLDAMHKRKPGQGMPLEDTRMQRQIWTNYLPSIYLREPIVAPRALSAPRAAQMPKIRDKLVEVWRSPLVKGAWERDINVGGHIYLPGTDCGIDDTFAVPVTEVTDDMVSRFVSRVTTGLYVSELLWVSPVYTHLAIKAGAKLENTLFTRADMPSTNGFIMYEVPIQELKAANNLTIPITAISWTLVPQGIWVIVYGPPEEAFALDNAEQVRSTMGWLIPWSSGGGAVFDSDLDNEEIVLRTLLATWFLMAQQDMTEEVEEKVHADIRRSYRKAGRAAPKVRVINLRRRSRPTKRDDEQPTRNYTQGWRVGFETGGFWNYYWTGPGRTVRDRRWIRPYIARDDLPLPGDKDFVPTVKVLK